MKLFTTINLSRLSVLIKKTQEELFICLPGIPTETANAIVNLRKQKPKSVINVLIDFDPQTFRQGYGEFTAFEQLHSIDIQMHNFPDNRISFVIADNIGYYLFFESQYLVPADKETLNAIKIDNVSLVKLKQHFFGKSNISGYTNELTNAIIEEAQLLKQLEKEPVLPDPAPTEKFTNEQCIRVKENIEKNPPLRPNHKRLIDSYTTIFQYVELKFSEVNIRNKIVKIPPELLPIRNETLREQFQTKIHVIDKAANIGSLNELTNLRNELQDVRKKYLAHLKYCNRSVLKIEDKNDFLEEIEVIKKKIPGITKDILKEVLVEMKKTQERYQKEFKELIIEKPTIVFDKDSMWINDKDIIRDAAEQKARAVINNIVWPDYFILLENMTINTFFSNITQDDLFDERVLNEFKEKELISEAEVSQLAYFNKSTLVTPDKN